MPREDRQRIKELAEKLPQKIVGYLFRGIGDSHPGELIGGFAGRRWYAEAAAKRIDWGGIEHGLNIQQMQFARRIQLAVRAEFWTGSAWVDMDGRTVEPQGLARFEEMLVTALHAYDTARTERLNFLEAEYRKLLDMDVGDYVVQVPAVGDAIGDRVPIFPFSAQDMQAARELPPMTMGGQVAEQWKHPESGVAIQRLSELTNLAGSAAGSAGNSTLQQTICAECGRADCTHNGVRVPAGPYSHEKP